MKFTHRVLPLLLIAGIMLGWKTSGSIQTQSSESAVARSDPTAKFEALALQELNAGSADFFVTLAKKADLSYASELKTKEAKGQYVYDTLVATANKTQADLLAFLNTKGAKFKPFYIANTILVEDGTLDLAKMLAERDDVARISANHKYQLDKTSIDVKAQNAPSGIEANIAFIKAPEVWALGITGQGTVIAGNDTGLYFNHAALIRHYRGCINPPACSQIDHNYNWWDATGAYPTAPNDVEGHGTHTTGTMVGDDGGPNRIGVAPGARTIHCKNLSDGGTGDDVSFIECFQWDLAPWDLTGRNPNPAKAPDVINNSWGYWGGGSPQFEDEINALQAAGIVIEVSAGNEGKGCSSLRSPGDYSDVLSTGSINHTSVYPGLLTSFSSRGPSALFPDVYFPSVMAPGERIRSSVPGGGYEGGWSGTSMSGPHTTALVALMWSANPALRGHVAETIDIIRQTAVPLTGQQGSKCGGNYTTGPNNDWGVGTINAFAAVKMALTYRGTSVIQGIVTDITTGLPVPGVKVQALRQEGGVWNDVTDSNGINQLAVVAGTFDITASVYGYREEKISPIDLSADQTLNQDFALSPLPIYFISGLIKDKNTGIPIAGAKIEVLNTPLKSIYTDKIGRYRFAIAEGVWKVRISSTTHFDLEQTVVINTDTTQDFLIDEYPCILLVDDDQNGPDVRRYYTDALDSLGYGYSVWDVSTNGDPGASDLVGYRQVIWFTGSPWLSTFTRENEAAVGAYLDAGGNFFLSSQDYLWENGITAFARDYMHIDSFTNDVNHTRLVGQNAFDKMGSYSLIYLFNNYSDLVNPDDQAKVAFSDAAGSAALTFDGERYNTIFFDFPFEAMPDLASRTATMERIVRFFGGCEKPPAVSLGPLNESDMGSPGTQVSYTYSVTNMGSTAQDFDISVASGWPITVIPASTGVLRPGLSKVITVTVTIPSTASEGSSDTFTITAAGGQGINANALGTTSAYGNPAVKAGSAHQKDGRLNRAITQLLSWLRGLIVAGMDRIKQVVSVIRGFTAG